jgi:hypothetical protein
MITLILFVVSLVMWVFAQAWALAKNTDSEQPFTYYVRRFLKSFGIFGGAIAFVFWMWVGCHFIVYEYVSC